MGSSRRAGMYIFMRPQPAPQQQTAKHRGSGLQGNKLHTPWLTHYSQSKAGCLGGVLAPCPYQASQQMHTLKPHAGHHTRQCMCVRARTHAHTCVQLTRNVSPKRTSRGTEAVRASARRTTSCVSACPQCVAWLGSLAVAYALHREGRGGGGV